MLNGIKTWLVYKEDLARQKAINARNDRQVSNIIPRDTIYAAKLWNKLQMIYIAEVCWTEDCYLSVIYNDW